MLIRKIGGNGGANTDPFAADVGVFLQWVDGAPADRSTNGITITTSGTPVEYNDTYYTDLIDFDGSTDLCSWPIGTAQDTANDWTLEVAFRMDALPVSTINFFRQLSTGGFFAEIGSTGELTIQVRDSVGVGTSVATGALAANRLHLVMLTHTFSTGALALSLGGAVVATGTRVCGSASGATGYFGGQAASPEFNGKGWLRFTKGVVRTVPFGNSIITP